MEQMVLQVITYETSNTPTAEFSAVMGEMKKFYLANGCKDFNVFREEDGKHFIEMALFDNAEAATRLDKLETVEKNELYKKFCAASNVIGETVEVKILEQI